MKDRMLSLVKKSALWEMRVWTVRKEGNKMQKRKWYPTSCASRLFSLFWKRSFSSFDQHNIADVEIWGVQLFSVARESRNGTRKRDWPKIASFSPRFRSQILVLTIPICVLSRFWPSTCISRISLNRPDSISSTNSTSLGWLINPDFSLLSDRTHPNLD